MKVIPREVKLKVRSWDRDIRNLQDRLILTKIQKNLLYGMILGDACISQNVYGKNCRLQISQCNAQQSYVLWKYSFFKEWCLREPVFEKSTQSWRFRTISHPELTELRSHFYPNGKKSIPLDIYDLLTDSLSLALWFMDDGTRGPQKGYTINTQNFSKKENEVLASLLVRNFGLTEVGLHKDRGYWRLYIRSKSAIRFKELIESHIIPSMRYKLNPVETPRIL